MELHRFRYHPDPLATGSIVPSDSQCQCCGERRGFAYTGVPSSVHEIVSLCPWCIADGSAHEKLGAEFVDPASVGDRGTWETVPREVAEEVAFRTPAFVGWQEERWFTHCGDAAAFIGYAGAKEIRELGREAIEVIEADSPTRDWEDYLDSLDKEGPPTAYMFRCLHCRKLGGYTDFD